VCLEVKNHFPSSQISTFCTRPVHAPGGGRYAESGGYLSPAFLWDGMARYHSEAMCVKKKLCTLLLAFLPTLPPSPPFPGVPVATRTRSQSIPRWPSNT